MQSLQWHHVSVVLPELELSCRVSAPTAQQPRLFIASGIHGDESGVIAPLTAYLQEKIDDLPPFVFIPEMSPSALQKGERHNYLLNDLNRTFGVSVIDAETANAEHLVRKYGPYDLVVSFHEDTELHDAYVYDTGERFYDLRLSEWRKQLAQIKIGLLNGIDEPDLNISFTNGYNYNDPIEDRGTFEEWVICQKLAKRSLTIEVPSSLTLHQKHLMIDRSFEHLILPAFSVA